jgi:hypothetical protein
MNNEETYVQRSTYTLFDAISNTGGLLGMLQKVLNVVLVGLEETFFFASAIGSLYYHN